ncbi:cache domain-containing sensor histidine kinase [Cellulosilyticum sp. WCF-2]|uniref:cache domain-containing sensor histidine kinase n=1 Tax=Cellulosilyticum sp. WCF-2 TaxID=2497860 RepID=UPI0016814865|nr:sensor histidine kinase [Cellulosilyticum sp. WCF-2]
MSSSYKNMTEQKRIKSVSWVLVKSYLITMGISLFFGMFLFQAILQREVNYKLQRGDQEALNTVSYFITRHMQESERISSDLATNLLFQNALSREDETNIRLVNRLLRDSLVGRNNIRSIHIITREGNVISEFKEPSYLKNDEEFLQQFDLQAIDKEKGSAYWGIGTNVLEPKVGNTLYLARVIRSKARLEPLGYLVVYLDPVDFNKDCDDILRNISMQVIIKDSSGATLKIPDNLELDNLEEVIKWKSKEYHYIKEGSKKYYYTVQEMSILNGMIMGLNIQARTNDNMNTILLFAVIMNIIFLSGASLIIKRKVVSPLKNIADKARVIGKQGKLDTRFTIDTGYTEVYDITCALDEMMEEIKDLVSEVKEKEKLQKRLELSIINHQVKPHFLYNTLNAASILVAIEEKESANELIKTLAKYYRACLSTGEDTITIEEELQIVKEYVKIAIIRNPNIVDITYDVDEEALKNKIPKITLQSLVENSIKYGIRKLGEPVNIHIDIKLDKPKNIMNISIEDDGVGISEEMIDKIMKGEKLEVKSGFGLKAIIARILLCYDLKDTNEVIEITSKCGEYTKILLKIPY